MDEKEPQAPIQIDYPLPNERMAGGQYTFRIKARAGGFVEVSIDGGEWLSCRDSVGFWWFDYRCQPPGRHRVVARVKNGGADLKTTARQFYVGAPATAPVQVLAAAAAAKPAARRGRRALLR